ncbi:hypothetical protein BOTBODRAFT_180709 [Botryobasidium botryosum FD-172 SS1]|uniref:F-box domain-containing protein n=1 Tax=Botryobasidium botryosum (strain FD-172 SS1) TaxID=930990 RepID=A0A067M785_BOTB1|nr:hypothetical protein BOTBODRAFT_180709 [Botryobasidium botryosum FD-172 SS1]
MASGTKPDPKASVGDRQYFHRLPYETILDIFDLITDDSVALICASQVCRLWRQVIHQAPELWYLIDLCLDSPDPEAQAKHWLRYAGNQPFSIVLRFPKREHRLQYDECEDEDEEDEEEEDVNGAGEAIEGEASFWRKNEVYLTDTRTESLAMALCQHQHRWRELSFQDTHYYNVKLFFTYIEAWGFVPQLESLDILIANHQEFPCPLSIPLKCVTGADVEVTFVNCLPKFKQAFSQAITYLALTIELDDVTNTILDKLRPCSNLQELWIDTPDSREMG